MNDPFGAGEFAKGQGTPRVPFLRADGHFGAESELMSVVEARRGVDEHGRRIHLLGKTRGIGRVLRQDAITVLRAMVLDVLNGLVDALDDLDAEHWT